MFHIGRIVPGHFILVPGVAQNIAKSFRPLTHLMCSSRDPVHLWYTRRLAYACGGDDELRVYYCASGKTILGHRGGDEPYVDPLSVRYLNLPIRGQVFIII